MRGKRAGAPVAMAALLTLAAWEVGAQGSQPGPAGPPARPDVDAAQSAPPAAARPVSPRESAAEAAIARARDVAAEAARRERDMAEMQDRLAASAATRRRLADEIDALQADRSKLNQALLDATSRAHATEDRLAQLSERLDDLIESDATLRRSLEGRRDTIAAVLAALQRMGRRPPPALLVRPDDILAAVRTSILLGSVLPELRDETQALARDLQELARLRGAIAADREALGAQARLLADEQTRLAALVAVRQQRLSLAEAETAGERARAEALARDATTLKELLERMEGEVASAERTADAARRAADLDTRQVRQRFAAAAFSDPARLAPKIPFVEARGLLPRPASGRTLRQFGDSDAAGGLTRGLSIGTRPHAIVSAAADGWVVFAGPFRSFGRLLIINAGSGYHLLFAGLDSINVDVGQFVLAGEAVGQMGEVASSSAALGTVEAASPVLYVEFRKDGVPVDPGPWWAKSQGEKVRG